MTINYTPYNRTPFQPEENIPQSFPDSGNNRSTSTYVAPAAQTNTQSTDVNQRILDMINANQGTNIGQSKKKEPTIRELTGPGKEVDLESVYNPPAVDERQIRRDTMRRFQGEIDATNRLYDTMVNEARIEGRDRLGGQRAISARGGALGSDFAASQKEEVLGANRDIISGINAERSAKISSILGLGRASAVEEIRLKTEARQQGIENYTAYLAGQVERDNGKLAGLSAELIRLGMDPNEMSADEIAEVAEQYGLSENKIKQHYSETLAAEEAAAAEVDLETRETESKIKASDALAYQRNTAAAKNLKDKTGSVDVDAYYQDLESLSGKDNKVSEETFNSRKKAWIADGGDPSDFDDNFFGYINKSYVGSYDLSSSFDALAKNTKPTPTRDTGVDSTRDTGVDDEEER